MSKLTVNRLQELAASLPKSEQLSNDVQCNIKGGCSSCEDTRRPPRLDGDFVSRWAKR
jgi:hypothetical protein